MAKQEPVLVAFNRGIVSPLGVARQDVKRIAMSAKTMQNWMPRILGSMAIRPGMLYLGSTYNNGVARLLPFIYSSSDTALMEFSDYKLRVMVADQFINYQNELGAVAGGDFPSLVSLNANWTDNDEAGAVSDWIAPNYMQLAGTGTNAAIRDQAVTVANAGGHTLRIVVARGPVTLRVGTGTADDSYINETTLREGTHSLFFAPGVVGSTFNIRFMSRQQPVVWVASCQLAGGGVMELPTPYPSSVIDLIRMDQSADVVFLACKGYQPMMIERRGTQSWSIVKYAPNDGPFRTINAGPITLAGSALSGNITLTASKILVRSTHVGALFQLTSIGQAVTKVMNALNDVTDSVKVTGVGTDRALTIVISGMTAGRVLTLQRSYDNSTWVDTTTTYAADTTVSYNDTLDNQIVWYRLKCTVVGAAGATTMTISLPTGSITGAVRVTAYTNGTTVSAEVLESLGGISATELWKESEWSDYRGWPGAVALHEGRLWFAGKSKIWGSIVDAYSSFDPDYVGDAGTIGRSLGSGPVDTVNWLVSGQRLLIGTQGSELSARSSSLDEPLTPTAFTVKPASTQGSYNIMPCKIDQKVMFVHLSGIKMYELSFEFQRYDYAANDMTAIVPEIGSPRIFRIAAQRQPDTRIHCVRSDGTVAINLADKTEDVNAWVNFVTDGSIEDVVVLPALQGYLEDQVYYIVKRTINGVTKRYIEKWAQSADCVGGQYTYLADSYQTYSPTTTPGGFTLTGLSHLEGKQVVVWADGADVGTNDDYTYKYTVSGGEINLDVNAQFAVVGLPYSAPFESMKLGSPTQNFSNMLNHYKNINHIGFVLANVHPKGLRFGPSFTRLDDMPNIESGLPIDQDTIRTAYDEQPIEFPGGWKTDTTICLLAQAPRPVTVLAASMLMEVS